MKTRLHLTVALAALALLVASCTTSTAGQIAGTPPEGDIPVDKLGTQCDDHIGLIENPAAYFLRIKTIEKATSTEVAASSQRAVVDVSVEYNTQLDLRDTAQIEVITSMTDPSSRTLAIGTDVAFSSRLPDGYDTYVGSFPTESGDVAQFIYLATQDGDIAFSGACHDQIFRQPIDAYRNQTRPDDTLLAVTIELMSDDATAQDFDDWMNQAGQYAPPTWYELAAEDRTLDIESTPPEILNQLTEFRITVTIPESWTAHDDWALGTFTPDHGWNTWTLLSASGEPVIPLEGYAPPGTTLDLALRRVTEDRETATQLGTFTLPNTTTDGVLQTELRIESPNPQQTQTDPTTITITSN